MPRGVKIDFRTKSDAESRALQAVLDALESARSSIDATVYKIGIERVVFELEEAAVKTDKDGNRVKIRLAIDDKRLKKEYRNRIRRLARENNVKIRKWTKGKLHMKLLIIDGERVLTGSYNWTKSAAGPNAELLLEFKGSDYGKSFTEKVFDKVWKDAKAEKLEKLPRPKLTG